MSCASCHFVGLRAAGQRPSAPLGDEPDDVGDPVAVGAQGQQRRIAAPQGSRHLFAMRACGLLEVGPQLFVDGELTGDTGFGVLQDDVADRR